MNRVGMRAEKIAEGDMAVQLGGGFGADIQMVCLQMGFIGVFECFAIPDAKVTLVNIADGVQTVDNGIENRIVRNDDIDVDAGLGRHPFHRGASDVFDAEDQVTDGAFDLCPDGLKIGSPVRIIGDNDDLSCFHKLPRGNNE